CARDVYGSGFDFW
nr:immunoglobulin heavy chain junction region [Macaca mulatta]MOV38938.1 immunoglobulin heavy chain junction region [Macaca mulatta]MOV38959.1 immunoglobulin heavy chain junction region [Macaca mulatta]MOV43697.1 immunoglobulin heavy chain junction region [Macaca mulatta]MOV44210.1 immunoglobulin heavy chain junction region [Macaca mulatta]